uniref:Uncharacterized protein n=1 Tax=Anguilla anguilla TaxID=7936 RepID=A0A0E9VH49_ANGAN
MFVVHLVGLHCQYYHDN